jgi:PGF-pre-PGF domain-containing protein
MPKSGSFKVTSIKQKLFEKLESNIGNPWGVTVTRTCVIFAMFALLLSLFGSTGADSFPPTPSKHIVVDETCISVSLTIPARIVFINVTEYDAKQIVKNVTLEFSEPITFVRFNWKVLSKRPSYLDALDSSAFLQYHAITFSTDNTAEPTNVKMDFGIEKDSGYIRDTEEETLLLYRYNGEKMEECAMEKVKEENDDFLYFKTEIEGSSSYVIVTRGIALSSWWFDVVLISLVVALITGIGIYGYRRYKLANLKKH